MALSEEEAVQEMEMCGLQAARIVVTKWANGCIWARVTIVPVQQLACCSLSVLPPERAAQVLGGVLEAGVWSSDLI